MGLIATWRRWRQARTLQRYAIPEDLWQDALAALPFLATWPATELHALRAMSVLFLCNKNIVGTRGFQITPFQRAVVAIQACVPVLKLGLSHYDAFETVVLCPDEFVTHAEWEDDAGVVHRDEGPLMGEAMPGGPVVLSWPDALDASRGLEEEEDVDEDFSLPGDIAEPPVNVVIHEFVHKLDMLNGEANGCPPLPGSISMTHWQSVMDAAYEDFSARVEQSDEAGDDLEIDAYAAEDPAEFFAVLSEVFFVAPAVLLRNYPEVYQCFRLFYRQDPGAFIGNTQAARVESAVVKNE